MTKNRDLLTRYFYRGVAAASPQLTLPAKLSALPPSDRTLVLGCGKAAAEMAAVAVEQLSGRLAGCVVTRPGHTSPSAQDKIEVIEASHPIPDALSEYAGERLLSLAREAQAGCRVLFMISGGGSSLICAPIPGLLLSEKQAIVDYLVRSGLPIEDINFVRRHMSRIKGGQLGATAAARGAELFTFIISDVANDDPGLVASGPSIRSLFDPERALTLLDSVGCRVSLPARQAIITYQPIAGVAHPVEIVATNGDALNTIRKQAGADGWTIVDLGGALTGIAAEMGRKHAAIAMEYATRSGRHLLVSGGELTVAQAHKDGRGGPNLEYLTGMLEVLDPTIPIEALAGDTDGIDGTEDNAGGYIDAAWAGAERARNALAINRSYDLFASLGGLVKTGPTRTNVNDIRMIAVEGTDK
ncbi:MAG: DUF4147 domain-containing protein [Sphingopyxis sp.]